MSRVSKNIFAYYKTAELSAEVQRNSLATVPYNKNVLEMQDALKRVTQLFYFFSVSIGQKTTERDNLKEKISDAVNTITYTVSDGFWGPNTNKSIREFKNLGKELGTTGGMVEKLSELNNPKDLESLAKNNLDVLKEILNLFNQTTNGIVTSLENADKILLSDDIFNKIKEQISMLDKALKSPESKKILSNQDYEAYAQFNNLLKEIKPGSKFSDIKRMFIDTSNTLANSVSQEIFLGYLEKISLELLKKLKLAF
jgi:hypothetical protein